MHYAPAVMQSLDADFVLRFGPSGDEHKALATIGFVVSDGHFFRHPRSRFTVEFPAGPLAIGSELITSWNIDRKGDEILRVLHPTDCVRDRFMAYYAWGDLSALDAAVKVARAVGQQFKRDIFERWATEEATKNNAYDLGRVRLFFSRLGPV